MPRGGWRGGGRPKKVKEVVSADDAGLIEARRKYDNGADFLLDVVNMEFEKLGVKTLTLDHRQKAAVELLPYKNQKMPSKVVATIDHSWADAVRDAEARRLRVEADGEMVALEVDNGLEGKG